MEVHLELLIGKKVLTLNGTSLGRLEEVHADVRGGRCYVEEYLVGTNAIFDRLSALTIGRAILGVASRWLKTSYRIPWDKLDLSDPNKPKLKCKVTQLKRI
jgi:sporulation protein YlmC with PRC-barrel domain